MTNRDQTLHSLFHRNTGKSAAKWQGYLQHYDRHFSRLQNQPLRLLEIGVQAGGSLEVWAAYFNAASLIIGCDIDPACGTLHYDDPRIKVLLGDINAPATLQSLAALTDTLDIVIDDGSHQSVDIIHSFVQLFPRLNEGGIYLIEDLHCSYWDSYGGGLYGPCSAIAFFKKIVDLMNRPVWGVNLKATEFLEEFGAILGHTSSENIARETDWRFLDDIHAIEFVNSMCVIHKRATTHNVLGPLVLSGIPSTLQYVAAEMSVPDQSTNIFSNNDISKQTDNERLSLAYQQISTLKQENIALTTQVYTSTKKFYDASLTIQQLEYQLKQLEQIKPHTDSGTSS
jgi:O-antigen biosynthesis protein